MRLSPTKRSPPLYVLVRRGARTATQERMSMYTRHSVCNPRQLWIVFPILGLSALIACASPELAGPDESPGGGPRAPGEPPGAAIVPAARRAPPASSSTAGRSVTVFESGQVRPLAMSPDRRHLFAVNTPDD